MGSVAAGRTRAIITHPSGVTHTLPDAGCICPRTKTLRQRPSFGRNVIDRPVTPRSGGSIRIVAEQDKASRTRRRVTPLQGRRAVFTLTGEASGDALPFSKCAGYQPHFVSPDLLAHFVWMEEKFFILAAQRRSSIDLRQVRQISPVRNTHAIDLGRLVAAADVLSRFLDVKAVVPVPQGSLRLSEERWSKNIHRYYTTSFADGEPPDVVFRPFGMVERLNWLAKKRSRNPVIGGSATR